MKVNRLVLALCGVAMGLMLAGCGGGGNSSSSSVTLAQGSDPEVNGSGAGSAVSSVASSPAVSSGGELIMMTVAEAMDRFEELDPELLGLPGESMSEYGMYPSEKAVPVDGIPCLKIIVYDESDSGTNEPVGTYLLARDGTAVYKLEGDQVTQMEMG